MRRRPKSQEITEEQKQQQKEEAKNRRQTKILTHTLKLKHIRPLTKNQNNAFHSYFEGKNILLYGLSGTGKTYISLYFALNDVIKGLQKRVIIVRSAVGSRDIGFLPGTIAEKMALYETPYKDMVADLCQKLGAYDLLKDKNIITFISTSFLRGITFDDSIILIDEVQNMSDHEISSILTRVGNNSRIIICGDFHQNDLITNNRKHQDSGMADLLKTAKRMASFDLIEFQLYDIVRSGFCKEYIIARYFENL